MRDFLFVSFFLGHGAGDRTRRLLAECELLDVALSSRDTPGAVMSTSASLCAFLSRTNV
jgi:hypothetical protein